MNNLKRDYKSLVEYINDYALDEKKIAYDYLEDFYKEQGFDDAKIERRIDMLLESSVFINDKIYFFQDVIPTKENYTSRDSTKLTKEYNKFLKNSFKKYLRMIKEV
jgi:hypothetical protein